MEVQRRIPLSEYELEINGLGEFIGPFEMNLIKGFEGRESSPLIHFYGIVMEANIIPENKTPPYIARREFQELPEPYLDQASGFRVYNCEPRENVLHIFSVLESSQEGPDIALFLRQMEPLSGLYKLKEIRLGPVFSQRVGREDLSSACFEGTNLTGEEVEKRRTSFSQFIGSYNIQN